MVRLKKSIMVLIMIISIQILVYAVFLRPDIMTWGATESEISMKLAGDSTSPFMNSTRAITIHAPDTEVWKWLVQLGADRGGFYSYTFIEHLSGYDTDNTIKIVPEFQEMNVGRVVPSSRSGSKLNWRVLAVDPGKSFLLEGWGPFVIKKIDSETTRLIVRTHGWQINSITRIIVCAVMEPLHYIMEKRMLMGFKARAEAGEGVELSSAPDYLWFFSVLLSFIGFVLMTFFFRNLQSIIMTSFFSLFWLWTLLIFDPQPVYSTGLLLVIIATSLWFRIKKPHQSKIPPFQKDH
ncbi:MAG: hypothetical protein MI863_00760 [Desulfobacterales bacterium]|nr:hypothetical protein [Desulfobacterales bacterium]